MYLLSVPVCAFQMVCLQVIGESLSSRGSAGIICLFCPPFLHMFVYLFTAIPLVLKRKTQMSEDLSLLKLIIYNLFRVLHRLLHQGLCNSGRSFPNGNPFSDLPEGRKYGSVLPVWDERRISKAQHCHHANRAGCRKRMQLQNYHIGDCPEREIGINTALTFRDQRMNLIPSLQHHLENKSLCWGRRQRLSSSGQMLLYQLIWCFPYIIHESEMSL